MISPCTSSAQLLFVWDGGGSDNRFSTDNNWVDNSAPPRDVEGTAVLFGNDAPGATQTVTLTQRGAGARTVGNLTIASDDGPDYDFQRAGEGGTRRTLTFDNGADNQAFLTITGNGQHTIGSHASQIVDIELASETLISNDSSGTIGLTLGQANHQFRLGDNAASFTGTGTTVVNSEIQGTGGLSQTGEGSLYIYNGNNSFTGPITVENGQLYGISTTESNFTFGSTAAGENFLGAGTQFTVNNGEAGAVLRQGGNMTFSSDAVLTTNGGETHFLNYDNINPGVTEHNFFFNGTANVKNGIFSLDSSRDMDFGGGARLNATGGDTTLTYGRDFTTSGANDDPVTISAANNATVTFQNQNAAGASFTLGQHDTIEVTGANALIEINNQGSGANTASIQGTLNGLENGTVAFTNTDTTITASAQINGGTLLLRNSNLTIDPAATFIDSPNVAFDSTATATIFGAQPDSGITGIGTLSVDGGGTVFIDASVNNIAATTIDIRGGTLMLGENHQIANTTNMRLGNDATFNTANKNEVLGTLTLSGNSSINLGDIAGDGSILKFAASGGSTWETNQTLLIESWNGSTSGGGTDQVYFGNTAEGLTSDQLSQILFIDPFGDGNNWNAKMLPSGEIVPVPEPAAIAAGIGLLALIGWRERRRVELIWKMIGQRMPFRLGARS